MNCKNLRIGTKLIGGFTFIAFIFTSAALYQNAAIRELRGLHAAIAGGADKVQLISDAEIRLGRAYAAAAHALSRRDPGEAKKSFEEVRRSAESDLRAISDIAAGREPQLADAFRDNYQKLLALLDKEVPPLLADPGAADEGAAREALNEKRRSVSAALAGAHREAGNSLEKLARVFREGNARAEQKFAATGIGFTGLGVVGIGLILAFSVAHLLHRLITVPVRRAAELAKSLAAGDLGKTLDVKQNDEIGMLITSMNAMSENLSETVVTAGYLAGGDLTVEIKTMSDQDALGYALKGMVARLAETITDIRALANNVAAGADQMNVTSQAVSQGAAEQASSLEEISSSMNEITAQTRHNAENASQANRLAAEAKSLAENGNAQMQKMVAAMRNIHESSGSISRIIKVIDEIAFQTNLLALNAAVEAARAGRHGKGFAVVAEEVRSLAARSAKAARETSEMIEGSVRTVEQGAGIADHTAQALSEIMAAASKLTDLVNEIAASSGEQAQGVTQILTGLGQVDAVTQQNTAHAEQSAAAAQDLSGQARTLQELVSLFAIKEKQYTQAEAIGGSQGKLVSIRELRESMA